MFIKANTKGRAQGPAPTIILLILFLLSSCLAFSASPSCYAEASQQQAFDVKVEDISNRAYFDAVIREINNAKDSIYVAMYAAYVRPTEVNNPAYKLLSALTAAHERGVAVKAYLDATSSNYKGNMTAYTMLKNAGVAVYFIENRVKLHAKLIVIDERVVIDGSSNWTQKAVEDNYESNELLRTAEFARAKLGFFRELDKLKVVDVIKTVKSVRVSRRFLEDERFCPRLVQTNAERALRFYLKLLHSASLEKATQEQGWVDIDYKQTARYLGISDKDNGKARERVRDLAKSLKAAGLIDYNLDEKYRLKIRLADTSPQEGYFEIPATYWDYGLDQELSALEKLVYFICLYEEQAAAPKLYWSRSLKALGEKYHIAYASMVEGFNALEKKDLIEVRRYGTKPGEEFDMRKANEYCLKELISKTEKAKRWEKLEKTYTRAMVADARRMASVWDKENNIDVVTGFITLIKQYGTKRVDAALKRISDYSPNNPARNTRYLKALLQ